MKKRTIYIEGLPLSDEKPSGVGSFILNITKSLHKKADKFDVKPFVPYYRRKLLRKRIPSDMKPYLIPVPHILAKYLLMFNKLGPIDLLMGRKNIYFFGNYVRWPLLSAKSIVVIHDMVLHDMPETMDERNLRLMSKYQPRSAKKASHVVTVSEYSKQRIHEIYKIDKNKISVVPNAYSSKDYHANVSRADKNRARLAYDINESQYILFQSAIEPRKNPIALIKAYEKLPKKLRKQYPLVLAGGIAWKTEEFKNYLNELNLDEGRVIVTGYVDEKHMAGLIAGASLFVFPSFYEGFGMSNLKAMACGVPVITSTTTAMPEVVEDAGITIEPKDILGLAEAIEKVLTDKALASDMSHKGLQIASKYSWDSSAEKLIDVINKLGDGE